MHYDYLIAGAGFAGAVCARKLADAGKKILVVDKRPHIGGNAYDEHDEHGVLVHRYGPHVFHTNSDSVFSFLSRFTDWRFYEHRVLAMVDGDLYPVPINRTTINRLYGWDLSEPEVADYLDRIREVRDPIRTSEDVVLARVGRDLCEKFFRGYTRKQWNRDLSELAAEVAARIPVRTNDDNRYFTDAWQFMPLHGYTAMFDRLLDHPNIALTLSTDWRDMQGRAKWRRMIYTGPIDAYFDFCFGALPYRSMRFDYQHVDDVAYRQPVGQINYPNEHDYTRVAEYKHLTGQHHRGTTLVYEYPQSSGDPYYPVPSEENAALYRRYQEKAMAMQDVLFIGRLAEYRYYNMDQVVEAALALSQRLIEEGQQDGR